jgi:hypothetical protein
MIRLSTSADYTSSLINLISYMILVLLVLFICMSIGG